MSSSENVRGTAGQFFYIRLALRLRVPLALATMFFAAAGLLANLANVDVMLRPLGDRAATHPITAACMFGMGLCIFRMRRYQKSPWWRYAVALSVVAICSVRLLDGILPGESEVLSAGIFGPLGLIHGRFSIEAAIALGTFAIAGMLRSSQIKLGLVFLVIGLGTVFNTLLEINYGLTFFNGNVGAFTLFGMVSLALSLVTVYIHVPFVRVSFLVGDIGAQTRIMALAVIALPWACGFILYRLHGIGGSNDPVFAVMISAIIWGTLVILMTTSARHEGSDAARRRAEREIGMLSRTDPLTGALNRFGMGEVLDGAWVSFTSTGTRYGMILVDLDHFKQINDTFGHDAGDDVLARVSKALRPHLRSTDALGRWGGEEFLIVMQMPDRDGLERVAERLRRALDGLQSPFLQGSKSAGQRVSASLGLSDMRHEDDGPADAIKRADAALYAAKEAGRNRVVPYYTLEAA